MTRICLVVTNGCAPDPRVERHARWLVELGHDVTIFAWDRETFLLNSCFIRDERILLSKLVFCMIGQA